MKDFYEILIGTKTKNLNANSIELFTTLHNLWLFHTVSIYSHQIKCCSNSFLFIIERRITIMVGNTHQLLAFSIFPAFSLSLYQQGALKILLSNRHYKKVFSQKHFLLFQHFLFFSLLHNVFKCLFPQVH